MSFDVNILGTGSTGNCVIIDGTIMIDCGLRVKAIQNELNQIDTLFITHRHGDHLNNAVVHYLKKEKPWIWEKSLYTNPNVIEAIRGHKQMLNFSPPSEHIIYTGTENFTLTSGGRTYEVECFPLDHDVPNQGFVFTNDKGERLVFATDTSTMKFAPRKRCDVIVVEGNYDEDKLVDYLTSDVYEERRRAIRNLRHLSIQQLEAFIARHSYPHTEVYQLHESEVFGMTLPYSKYKGDSDV